MSNVLKAGFAAVMTAATVSTLIMPGHTQEQQGITVFTDNDYRGSSQTFNSSTPDLRSLGLNDKISSIDIKSGTWKLCTEVKYGGRCLTLGPGQYRNFAQVGPQFNDQISSIQPVQVNLSLTVYKDTYQNGSSTTLTNAVPDLRSLGMNDNISSADIKSGTWQFCTDAYYKGRCVTVEAGKSGNFAELGINDQVSSIRPL